MIPKLPLSVLNNFSRATNVTSTPWLNWFWLMPGKSSWWVFHIKDAIWGTFFANKKFTYLKILIISDSTWKKLSKALKSCLTSHRRWWMLMPWNPGFFFISVALNSGAGGNPIKDLQDWHLVRISVCYFCSSLLVQTIRISNNLLYCQLKNNVKSSVKKFFETP